MRRDETTERDIREVLLDSSVVTVLLLCDPHRSMESVCADTTQLVTTVSAVRLSTTTDPGRRPTVSPGHRTSVRVSDGTPESITAEDTQHVDSHQK